MSVQLVRVRLLRLSLIVQNHRQDGRGRVRVELWSEKVCQAMFWLEWLRRLSVEEGTSGLATLMN